MSKDMGEKRQSIEEKRPLFKIFVENRSLIGLMSNLSTLFVYGFGNKSLASFHEKIRLPLVNGDEKGTYYLALSRLDEQLKPEEALTPEERKAYFRQCHVFLNTVQELINEDPRLGNIITVNHDKRYIYIDDKWALFILVDCLLDKTKQVFDMDDPVRLFHIQKRPKLARKGAQVSEKYMAYAADQWDNPISKDQFKKRATNMRYSHCLPYAMHDIRQFIAMEERMPDDAARLYMH